MSRLIFLTFCFLLGCISAQEKIENVHETLIKSELSQLSDKKQFNEESFAWLEAVLKASLVPKSEDIIYKIQELEKGAGLDATELSFKAKVYSLELRQSLFMFSLKVSSGNAILGASNSETIVNIKKITKELLNTKELPEFKEAPVTEEPSQELKELSDDEFLEDIGDDPKEENKEENKKNLIPDTELNFKFLNDYDGFKLYEVTNSFTNPWTWMNGLLVAVKGKDVYFLSRKQNQRTSYIVERTMEHNKNWFNRTFSRRTAE